MRRAAIALLTTLFAAALLVAPGLTPKAAATTAGHYKVGTITGRYAPAPARDYRGEFWPWENRCVTVQRLSGGGVWTGNYVYGGINCTSSARAGWSITNDAKVADTFGIRLFVTSGFYAGSYIRVCSTKSECLAMRTGGG